MMKKKKILAGKYKHDDLKKKIRLELQNHSNWEGDVGLGYFIHYQG